MSDPYDLLLIGGTLVNPATGIHQPMDVGVTDGRIAQIAPSLAQESVKKILDVHGGYVTPGLIDFHVHSYWGVNPYGFNADPICLASGVTTAVDAGSSGAVNFSASKNWFTNNRVRGCWRLLRWCNVGS